MFLGHNNTCQFGYTIYIYTSYTTSRCWDSNRPNLSIPNLEEDRTIAREHEPPLNPDYQCWRNTTPSHLVRHRAVALRSFPTRVVLILTGAWFTTQHQERLSSQRQKPYFKFPYRSTFKTSILRGKYRTWSNNAIVCITSPNDIVWRTKLSRYAQYVG